VIWHPYLPEPRPAFKLDADDPEPVPLKSLWEARCVCEHFRVPPRQFRRRTPRGIAGTYWPKTDIVVVNPDRADADGFGGDDGHYATLQRLLHATGHPSRLDRATTTAFTTDEFGEKREPFSTRSESCSRTSFSPRKRWTTTRHKIRNGLATAPCPWIRRRRKRPLSGCLGGRLNPP
jgi:hypothetical protein